MLNFIGSSESGATEALLTFLKGRMSTAEIAEEAVQAWGLLATSLPDSYSTKLINDLPLFAKLLESGDLDVRLAAGENIALLVELAAARFEREHGEEEGAEFDLASLSTDGFDMDETVDALKELAAERARHQSRKEQLRQRSGFKDLVRSIEDGVVPEEKLVFNKSPIVFRSWVHLKQLNAVRDALGEGLQAHFIENPLLSEVFSATVSKSVQAHSMSAVEKRMVMSPSSFASKARSKAKSTRGRAREFQDE
jgi:hypothetical protein